MEPNYEKIEEYLNSQEPLSLKGVSEIPFINVNDFVLSVLRLCHDRDTIYPTGLIQTMGYRRRSIGDIYRICKTYRPEIRFEEVKNALNNLISKTDIGLCTLICPDIHRRVWRIESSYSSSTFYNAPTDEFGSSYDLSNVSRRYSLNDGEKDLHLIDL